MKAKKINIIIGQDNLENIHALRREVFIEEQGVDEEIELDGEDYKCTHISIEDENRAIACVRIIKKDEHYYLGRIAVLKSFRNYGYGREVVAEAEKYLITQGVKTVFLNSQFHAKMFYEKLGYNSFSNIFLEAGIEHVAMKKELN